MVERYYDLCFIISMLVLQVTSQIVWINPDTGKVLGVTPSKTNRPPQQPQGNYQVPNYGGNQRPVYHHQGNHHWGRPNVQQNQLPEFNNPNAEWVCKNRAGDTMIITSEVDTKTPGQTQPPVQQNYPNQPITPDQPYDHNPWLDKQRPQPPNQNQQNVQPNQPNWAQPTDNEGNVIVKEPVTVEPTTSASQKPIGPESNPFPTLENIDWTKYLETSTKKPTSLNGAISGEGILEPRGGNNY